MMRSKSLRAASALALVVLSLAALAGVDRPTKFTNRGSVANTRHNLTQRPPEYVGSPINDATMSSYRNDYGEVCVYCHTPHGASGAVTLPLWNRTIRNATGYTTYDQLETNTLTQTVSQPGANSLACLSCHDGQTAVDSVINMPGSGRYLASQATGQSETFLDSWPGPYGESQAHMALNPTECLACHSTLPPYGMIIGASATDFMAAYIGTDLRNDHPVGITYPPSGTGTDFNTPGGNRNGTRFFDLNGNGAPDKDEIRVYSYGGGSPRVECASCHDPHGVPSGGPGSSFYPTFLRVSNTGSAVCLTCHTK